MEEFSSNTFFLDVSKSAVERSCNELKDRLKKLEKLLAEKSNHPFFPPPSFCSTGADSLGRKQKRGKLSKFVSRVFGSSKTKGAPAPVYYLPGDVLSGQFIIGWPRIHDKDFKWQETRTWHSRYVSE
jgi:hypothetical protein